MNDAQPPSNEAPLCERLEPIDEDRNHTSALVDRVVSFDQQESSMNKWLTAFGVEDRNYELMQPVDANQSKEDVTASIGKVIANILDNKQAEKESLREMYVIKIRQMMEKKAQAIAAEAIEENNLNEKSIDEADLNKTGELSKLS